MLYWNIFQGNFDGTRILISTIYDGLSNAVTQPNELEWLEWSRANLGKVASDLALNSMFCFVHPERVSFSNYAVERWQNVPSFRLGQLFLNAQAFWRSCGNS